MLTEFANYGAAAATTIAACMTAANLGPRITGWGFVVFTTGSMAWSAVAANNGETSLLFTNVVLTVINAIGVWRWLGRIARFDDGAKAAETTSERANTPTLVNIGAIDGRPITDTTGVKIGTAVGVMAAADSGAIAYVVVATGGIGGVGERLVALPWHAIQATPDMLIATLSSDDCRALPTLDPSHWPARAPR